MSAGCVHYGMPMDKTPNLPADSAEDGDDELEDQESEGEVNQEILSETFSTHVKIWGGKIDSEPLQGPSHFTNDYESNSSWQLASKSTVRERNAAVFNTELMADVHFKVGSPPNVKSIPAHKYVLATGSSVFHAMFYGTLAQASESTSQNTIEVSDVEPHAFLNLLRYLYCDEMEVEANLVLDTLYAAKKYMVSVLARRCVSYLETQLTAENAALLLSRARLLDENELASRCWQVIDIQAEEALNSHGICEVDKGTLDAILCRDTLVVNESTVWRAAVAWAKAECIRQSLEESGDIMRKLLGESIYNVRLAAMPVQLFADIVAKSGILSLQETVDIFIILTGSQQQQQMNDEERVIKSKFSSNPRCGLPRHRVTRFAAAAFRSNQWRYRGRIDAITVSVDRKIWLTGVGLYGSSNSEPSSYDVRLEVKQISGNASSVLLSRVDTTLRTSGTVTPLSINLHHPLTLLPGAVYTVSVLLDGTDLSYFGQEGASEVRTSAGVTFTFRTSPESTNGTGVHGGQIPELFFYC